MSDGMGREPAYLSSHATNRYFIPNWGNPYIQFGFMDKETLINRLKKIENIKYWNISQIGDDVTIDLKPYE